MTLIPALTATARSAARQRQASHALAVRVALVERLQVKAQPAARVQALAADTGDQIAELAQQLADEDIDQGEFSDRVRDVLLAAGASAAALAGVDDASLIDDLVEGRADFLEGFSQDVAGGGMSAAAIVARSALWGGAVWSMYQAVRRSDQPEGTLVTWTLSPGADHCESCLEYADGSPYSLDDAPTPGVDTDCLSRCLCELSFEAPGGEDGGA